MVVPIIAGSKPWWWDVSLVHGVSGGEGFEVRVNSKCSLWHLHLRSFGFWYGTIRLRMGKQCDPPQACVLHVYCCDTIP
jgi:hypothetical protein